MDTEKVLKALEQDISRRFQEEVRKERPTFHFETPSTRRPAGEETFTQRLERLARQPEPREPTFTERLERLARQDAEGVPDFRTEGEKRRDSRRAVKRREAEGRNSSPLVPKIRTPRPKGSRPGTVVSRP